MKRRVGKYKNKIIVEGDKNEFKPHEVGIKELAAEGKLIKVFFSLKEASEYVNAPYQGIQRVLKGQRFLCRGLHWKYYETETN